MRDTKYTSKCKYCGSPLLLEANAKNGTCKKCHSIIENKDNIYFLHEFNISNNYITIDYGDEIEKLNSIIEENGREMIDAKSNISDLCEEVDDLLEQLDLVNKEKKKLANRNSKLERKNEKILDVTKKLNDKISILEDAKKELERVIKKNESDKSDYKKRISKLNDELDCYKLGKIESINLLYFVIATIMSFCVSYVITYQRIYTLLLFVIPTIGILFGVKVIYIEKKIPFLKKSNRRELVRELNWYEISPELIFLICVLGFQIGIMRGGNVFALTYFRNGFALLLFMTLGVNIILFLDTSAILYRVVAGCVGIFYYSCDSVSILFLIPTMLLIMFYLFCNSVNEEYMKKKEGINFSNLGMFGYFFMLLMSILPGYKDVDSKYSMLLLVFFVCSLGVDFIRIPMSIILRYWHIDLRRSIDFKFEKMGTIMGILAILLFIVPIASVDKYIFSNNCSISEVIMDKSIFICAFYTCGILLAILLCWFSARTMQTRVVDVITRLYDFVKIMWVSISFAFLVFLIFFFARVAIDNKMNDIFGYLKNTRILNVLFSRFLEMTIGLGVFSIIMERFYALSDIRRK